MIFYAMPQTTKVRMPRDAPLTARCSRSCSREIGSSSPVCRWPLSSPAPVCVAIVTMTFSSRWDCRSTVMGLAGTCRALLDPYRPLVPSGWPKRPRCELLQVVPEAGHGLGG